MKRPLIGLYFTLVILEIASENFYCPSITVSLRILAISMLFLEYYQIRKSNFTTLDRDLGIALSFAAIGLTTTYLLPRNENYLFVNSIIYFFEIQIYIRIIRNRFYQKMKSPKDELLKLILIFTTGILFIYFCFPIMRFADQVIVFIRMMQYSFFLAFIYKNEFVNTAMHQSFWLIVASNTLVILEFYQPYSYPLFLVIMPTFFISKYYLVQSLIQTERPKL